MRAAARYANAFNINVSASAPEQLPDQLRALDAACAAERRDPKTLVRSAFLMACVGKTYAEAEQRVNELAERAKMDRVAFLESRPGLIYGTRDDALAKLNEYRRIGVEHVNLMFQPFGSELAQMALLADSTRTAG
jgi:alkanesulfonate monooxygenase SsuD/methylene tetrahydromethanopterin reductase-like flavin-dependent oxidoreductase (luciferase family)